MKEINTPEKEQPQPVEEKPKKVRNYLHLEDAEINELISTYRKLLRIENPKERDLLTTKIEELERELKYRSKLIKTKE